MTKKENLKKVRKRTRKEIREEYFSGEKGERLLKPDLDTMARQLLYIDDVKTKIFHSARAGEQNKILKGSEQYPQLLLKMRDKGKDREKIAQEIKEVLEDEGYTTADITELGEMSLMGNRTYQLFEVAKRETEKELLELLMTKPIWTHYLLEVTGISVLTASKLLCHVGGVRRFSQPSKLIKYSGLAVSDGETQRKRKGQECDYKPELKALLLGVIADNFIKSNSEYRVVYDERKEKMMRERPEWGEHPHGKKKQYLAHYHADAKRYMMKRFVHEFWDAGWLLSGVQPPSKPYAVSVLGHDMEPKIVPIRSGRGLVYSWSDAGVLDRDRRILYSWGEWQDYVDGLSETI